MNEKEQEMTELDLEDILKEFGDADDAAITDEAASEVLKELLGDEPEEEPEEIPAPSEPEKPQAVTGDTIRLDDLSQVNTENTGKEAEVTMETVRLNPTEVEAAMEAAESEAEEAEEETAEAETAEPEETEETDEDDADENDDEEDG